MIVTPLWDLIEWMRRSPAWALIQVAVMVALVLAAGR